MEQQAGAAALPVPLDGSSGQIGAALAGTMQDSAPHGDNRLAALALLDSAPSVADNTQNEGRLLDIAVQQQQQQEQGAPGDSLQDEGALAECGSVVDQRQEQDLPHSTPAAAAAAVPPASGTSLQDGSAPAELGVWPALQLLGSAQPEGDVVAAATASQAPTRPQQQPGTASPAQQPEQRPGPAESAGQHASADPGVPKPADGQAGAPAAADAAAGSAGPAAVPAGDMDWQLDEELDDYLAEQQQQQQQRRQQQQRSRPAAGAVAPAAPVPAGAGGAAGGGWEDDLDDLLMEQQELQQHQQQQQQQQQQAHSRPAPVQPYAGGNWDDELDDLLMEQQELQQQQHNNGPPAAASGAAAPGRAGYAAAAAAAAGVADLDAELDELDAWDGSGPPAYSNQQAAHASSRAGVPAAAANMEMDFGDELDGLFEQQQDAGDVPGEQPSQPPVTNLKPATLESLGMGTAAERQRAAAMAALQAASVPPRQLASAVQGCSMTVTGSSGQRVYCQLEAARPKGDGGAPPAAAAGGVGGGVLRGGRGLLAQPIEVLLDSLAEKRRQEVLAEFDAAHALAAELQAIVDGTGEEEQDAAAAAQQQQEQQQHSQQHSQQPQQRQLWVDKYAPAGFLSLLSEPRINREIAAWVAKWNRSQQQGQQQQQAAGGVGNGLGLKQQQQPQQQQQQQQQQKAQGPAAGRGRGDGGGRGGGAGRGRGREGSKAEGGGAAAGSLSRGFDAARWHAAKEARAAARVLLLVGPPGTGKTTLAHVVAGHCGFRVVEVNASDERSAAALTRRITDVAQMTSVLDGARRPPCIVLDELDGAAHGAEGHSAVAALVKLVTGDGSAKRSKKRAASGKPGAGRGGGGGGLGVPIICTANDAYAPCLRPLREVAAVYHVKPPGPEKLMGRLAGIAAAERLALDRQALHELVERSGCDVRTSINTLQLLARQAAATAANNSASSQGRPRVRITAAAVSSSGAFGVKDVSRTPLGVLGELLLGSSKAMAARLQQLAAAAMPRGGSRAGGSGSGAAPGRAAVAARLRLQEHYSMLLDLGEHELVMAGLHEALPEAVGLDVDMAASTAAAAALADAELMTAGSGGAAHASGRSMFQYVPACLLAASQRLRRESSGLAGTSNVQWPRAQSQCAAAAAANRAMLRSWRAAAPAAAARQLGSGSAALLELGPGLAGISRPRGIKAVSRSLLSGQQAAMLDHVVGCLVGYGLTYSFPVGEEEAQPQAPPYAAAPGAPLPRPAPLAPPVDSLHCYSCLGVPDSSSAAAPGSRAAMSLVLRQMLAQMISAANIARIEQARHHGELPSPRGHPGTHSTATGKQPTGSAAKPAFLHHKAAAKAAPMPASAAKPAKGCWLDAMRSRAAPKRKAAAAPAGEAAGSAKRAATDGGGDEAGGGEGSKPGGAHSVLYAYNEGYTNAVKRPMKVAELLGG
uniref:AAA+ ATPase domain-containing protein n=1 Tax=Tetradesmus obliquus TaxID=3088 RepID=A0A383W5P0_TETOB|eukprot:jgi/Sobl393_1/10858/SZX72948.1